MFCKVGTSEHGIIKIYVVVVWGGGSKRILGPRDELRPSEFVRGGHLAIAPDNNVGFNRPRFRDGYLGHCRSHGTRLGPTN
jgi:hypothetical protein